MHPSPLNNSIDTSFIKIGGTNKYKKTAKTITPSFSVFGLKNELFRNKTDILHRYTYKTEPDMYLIVFKIQLYLFISVARILISVTTA